MVEILGEILYISHKGGNQDACRGENNTRGKRKNNYKGKGGIFN